MVRLYGKTRLKQFLQLEATSAVFLFAATLFSLSWANSPWAVTQARFAERALFFVNDGLMTLFFLEVGLALKRGWLQGELSRLSQVLLPGVSAIFGMIMPVLVYCAINYHHPNLLKGWAIPIATDIAFAVGVLALLGRRVPFALKLFLLSVAIFDDLGAVLVISVFFSQTITPVALMQVGLLMGILYLLNRLRIKKYIFYLLAALMLWFALLQAGIHPTMSGFILAICLPSFNAKSRQQLLRLEDGLHPWVAFGVMPLFALVNAGVSFGELTWAIWGSTLVLGVAAGLFIGKQAGVMMAVYLIVKSGLARLPEKTGWLAMYGVSILCGIGFTMSLFLGTLSFPNDHQSMVAVRLGVMIGSLLSGLVGFSVLLISFIKGRRTV